MEDLHYARSGLSGIRAIGEPAPCSRNEPRITMAPMRCDPSFDGSCGDPDAGTELELRAASGGIVTQARKNVGLLVGPEPEEPERRIEGPFGRAWDSQQPILGGLDDQRSSQVGNQATQPGDLGVNLLVLRGMEGAKVAVYSRLTWKGFPVMCLHVANQGLMMLAIAP
jgi:hypothetical protein